MSDYHGPKCRQCRREAQKLFLKGTKCFSSKCPVEKRNTVPGQHGARRGRLSDYGTMLRGKTKGSSYLRSHRRAIPSLL